MRLKHVNGMQTESDIKSAGCRAVALRLADNGTGNSQPTIDCDNTWYGAISRRPSIIDECARKLFPLVFVCFNFAYWVIYINLSKKEMAKTNN